MQDTEEQKHYELRARGNRSRSMTPSKQQDNEHYNLRRRRSATPASSEQVTSTGNKVMESILEHDDTVIIKRTNSERRSERIQKSNKKHISNGQEEAGKKSIRTSDYSSEEGDRDDSSTQHLGSAFEFYKQKGGDYWNKFPKTDYTYSPSSTCRYEFAPNVIAPPNMSRRSLRSTDGSLSYTNSQSSQNLSNHSEDQQNEVYNAKRYSMDKVPQVVPHIRVSSGNDNQYTVYKKTYVTQYTTRHDSIYDSADENMVNERIYEKWASPLRNNKHSLSDAELDDEFTISNSHYRYKRTNNSTTQRVSKLTSIVSTCFFTILHLLTFNQFKKEEFSTSQYYRSYQESRWSKYRRWIDILMQHMYLVLVKVLLLDSWLLSRASNIRKRVEGRRAKVLGLLLLLPLVLAVGWFLLSYLLSSIPLNFKSVPSSLDQNSFIPHYVQDENSNYEKYNQELKNTVDLLLDRVRNLEESKSQQMEKMVSLEKTLEYQNTEIKRCKTEEMNMIRDEFKKLKLMYAELKSCCDESSKVAAAPEQNQDDLKKQAEQVIAGYFPNDFSKQDIVRLFQIMNSKIQESNFERPTSVVSAGDDEIRRIVTEVLKVYDADKTGRVDYALESAGGQIVSTRCTQRYNIHTRAFKILGLTLYYESNNPRTVIQGNNLQPGMCWAFQDFPGYLLVKLRSPIYITGFTVEHAPKANLPNGEMKSAPKKFEVWGLKEENDLNPVIFGEYDFLDNDQSLQYFPVQNTSISSPYEYVEMRIHSNHGQLEYTCLYRFRVHGTLA